MNPGTYRETALSQRIKDIFSSTNTINYCRNCVQNFFIDQNHITATQKIKLEKLNFLPNATVESGY